MSLNISLIEYESSNGKLYEENLKVIETAFLSQYILELIKEKFSLCEAQIFEEKNSFESSTIEYIPENAILGIKELLENEFSRLVDSDECKTIKSVITPDRIYATIELFRTLTNVYHIFWLKSDSFYKRNDVLIKIG